MAMVRCLNPKLCGVRFHFSATNAQCQMGAGGSGPKGPGLYTTGVYSAHPNTFLTPAPNNGQKAYFSPAQAAEQQKKMDNWVRRMRVIPEGTEEWNMMRASEYEKMLAMSESEPIQKAAQDPSMMVREGVSFTDVIEARMRAEGVSWEESAQACNAIEHVGWRDNPERVDQVSRERYSYAFNDPWAREFGDGMTQGRLENKKYMEDDMRERLIERLYTMGMSEEDAAQVASEYPDRRLEGWERAVKGQMEVLPAAEAPEWEPYSQDWDRKIKEEDKQAQLEAEAERDRNWNSGMVFDPEDPNVAYRTEPEA